MVKRVAAKAVRGRPRSFDRGDIVDCALLVLERDGVQALTLRGVARELGVALGTLNNYFDSLAALEDAVAARILSQVPALDASRPEPLRDQLVEMGLALIGSHSQHPYLRHITGPASIEIGIRWLVQSRSALETMGLSAGDAALCVEMIQSLAYGRGIEMHRVRTGGAAAWARVMNLWKKIGPGTSAKLKPVDFSTEKMVRFNRDSLRHVVDTLLRGFERAGQ